MKNDKEGYKKIIDNLNNYKIKSTDDMASDYKKIYDVNITRENYKIGKLISAQTNEENNTYSANLDEILKLAEMEACFKNSVTRFNKKSC